MKKVVSIADRDTCESAVVRSQIVGAAVVTMAGFGFTAAELQNARYAFISVHDAPINFLCTGDPPTAALGIPLGAGQSAIVSNNIDINNLQFIRSGGANANVTISLEWNLVPDSSGG